MLGSARGKCCVLVFGPHEAEIHVYKKNKPGEGFTSFEKGTQILRRVHRF